MLLKGLDLQWPVYKVVNELLSEGAEHVTVTLVHERMGKKWEYTTIKTTLDRLADQGWLTYGPRITRLRARTYLNGATTYVEVRRQLISTVMDRLYGNDEALLFEDLAAIKEDPRYKEVQDAARLHRRTTQKAIKQATRAKNQAILKAKRKEWDKKQAQKTTDAVAMRKLIKSDPIINILIGGRTNGAD